MKLSIEIHNAAERTPAEIERIVYEVAAEVAVDLSNGHTAMNDCHLSDPTGAREATYSFES